MLRDQFRIRVRTLMALVALAAAFLSVASKDAQRRRGCVLPGDDLTVAILTPPWNQTFEGTRRVRFDGRLDLGSFGALRVDGLSTSEIKVEVIRHLGRYLDEKALGLVDPFDEMGRDLGKPERVSPADSSMVYVDFAGQSPETSDLMDDAILDHANYFFGLTPSWRSIDYVRSCCPSPEPTLIETARGYAYWIAEAALILALIYAVGRVADADLARRGAAPGISRQCRPVPGELPP